MNNRFSLAVRAAAILLLAALPFVSCVGDENEDSLPVGLLSEATMATGVDDDNRPVNQTNVFPTDAVGFFCSFKINDAPPDTKIKAEWIYVGGDVEAEIGENYTIEVHNGTAEGTGYTHAVLWLPPIPDYEWPRGDYKVVLYVDDEEEISVPFKVE